MPKHFDAQPVILTNEAGDYVAAGGGGGGGTTNPNGQATMANSSPVVIASDQSAVPVSASTLPLPSGASTSALQGTGNASLASIDGKVPAKGQTTAANSTPVVLASDQGTVPVSLSGNQAVNINQVGGSSGGVAGAGAVSSGTIRVTQGTGGTPSHTAFAASTLGTSQTGIAAGSTRQGLIVLNNSSVALYLRFGANAATTTDADVVVQPNVVYEVPRAFCGLELRLIGANGSGTGYVTVAGVV